MTAALVAALGAGCTAGAQRPAGPPATVLPTTVLAGAPSPWLTYHHDAARSGFVPGLPAAGRLAIGWSRPLDGAVYGQPLVVGSLVIAATENDSVYGLDWSTGRVRWRTNLGRPLPLSAQPCGNIDPLGITSTPVYDRATGLVYALAQVGRAGHLLAGLDPATGRVAYRRTVPSPDGRPGDDQQRGALAAANGRVYVTFGGHYGDCGRYIGSVVGMPAAGSGRIVSYLVPARSRGGIWASGGPAIAADGTVFVGVGNGAPAPPFDGTDSATALTPGLRPASLFAPRSWAADNAADLDLGAMTPALAGPWLLAVGKRGTGFVLRAGRLGGIGGQLASAPVCAAFGGAAVLPASRGVATVLVPCAAGGPAAVAVGSGRLRVLWRGPAGADGSPVAGGGAIWVASTSSGVLYELSPATGSIRHQIGLGSALPHFASPSLSGSLVLIGTLYGVVAVTGGLLPGCFGILPPHSYRAAGRHSRSGENDRWRSGPRDDTKRLYRLRAVAVIADDRPARKGPVAPMNAASVNLAIEVIWACLAALLALFLMAIARLPPEQASGPLPAAAPDSRGWPQAATAGRGPGTPVPPVPVPLPPASPPPGRAARGAPSPPATAPVPGPSGTPAATRAGGRGRYQPRHGRGRTPQHPAGPPWGPAAPPPGRSR